MPRASSTRLTAGADEQLLLLAGYGHERYSGLNYYYDARLREERPQITLQLTLDGVGFVKREGEPRRLLPAGHAFLMTIPGPFEYGWAAGNYEQVFVSFTGATAHGWLRRVHRQHGATFDCGVDSALDQTMLSFVESHRTARGLDRFLISGQLYGLLMQLLSVLARKRIAATPLVAECLKLIQARAEDPSLNVEQLAQRLGRSREHLTREVRDATGAAPLAHLVQARVRLAAAELRAGPTKLETVARRSGFSSAAYLCRVFHKTVGVTPVQFRDQPWLVVP